MRKPHNVAACSLLDAPRFPYGDWQAKAKAAPKKHLTGLAKLKHEESVMTTGKDFEQLHGTKAKRQDKKVLDAYFLCRSACVRVAAGEYRRGFAADTWLLRATQAIFFSNPIERKALTLLECTDCKGGRPPRYGMDG